MKILFVTSEMAPLAKSGGLGDVCGALPKALNNASCEVRVVMPLYRQIKEKYSESLYFLRWSMIRMGWRTMYSGLYRAEIGGVTVYFIDNEFYFGHSSIYLDYSFDIERFCFFQRAVLEALGEPMDFEPNILHLHDWQTGMIPVLLEAHYKNKGYHTDVQTLMTVHNLKFQGIHGREIIADLLDLPTEYLSESGVLKDGVPNFLKTGIAYSNRVTTVSPTYAREIMTDYYGENLNGIIGMQRWKIQGILNGIDEVEWNPRQDALLEQSFNGNTWRAGKANNKLALQVELGLEQTNTKPLAVMVSRLAEQKGLDLLVRVAENIVQSGIQVAILGTGDAKYERELSELAEKYSDSFSVTIAFENRLAHRLYAAADIFLMPSLFEPCGLSQLVAMRYGTLPVVRETGGLADTVIPYNQYTGEGTGFSFANINAHEFLYTLQNAASLWLNEPSVWQKLVRRAMGGDYSWKTSAQQYRELYKKIIEETGGVV